MFVLGLNEFLRNIRRNILAVLQLIMVYVLAIFTISAYVEQMSLYGGVSGFLDDTGILADVGRADDEQIKSMLTKVESIGKLNYISMAKIGDTTALYRLVSWNGELVKYKVPLIQGRWCEEGSAEDGVIRVVISNRNPLMWEVGKTYTFENSHGTYKFKVMGIYDTKELVFGTGGKTILRGDSYLNYYCKELEDTHQFIFIASEEDMIREYGDCLVNEEITINFEDDITEEEYNRNWQILSDYYGLDNEGRIRSTKEIYELSQKLLQVKLLPIGVVFLVAVAFSVMSVLTSSAVTVLYEKRNYGIYFISGNNWGNTVRLSLIHWTIASAAALIIAGFVCALIKLSGKFTQFALSFGGYHVLGIVIITLILLLMAAVLPYRMLRKLQPISVLKNNG